MRACVAAAIVATLSGCSEEGSALPDSRAESDGGGTGAGPAPTDGSAWGAGARGIADLPPCEPGFSSIRENIFVHSCTFEYCHGDNTPVWLELLRPGAEDFLRSRKSGTCPDYALVEPGAPERSYLYLKIVSDRPPCGTERMPAAGPLLPPHSIACVEEWIRDLGAEGTSEK